MAQGIFLTENNRQLLMNILTDYVALDKLTNEEREQYPLIVQAVGLAFAPKPVGLEENIGSCEPDPVSVRWDKTGRTWHTDVDKVGRYSVRRTGLRMPYCAFLNNQPINAIERSADVDEVKKAVERRIRHAVLINNAVGKVRDVNETGTPETISPSRKELIEAAQVGVHDFLQSTRGAVMFGADSKLIETKKGFVVVYGNDNRAYFDVTEM